MFSEDKVTEIYCMADDFCKEFAKVQEKYMMGFHAAACMSEPTHIDSQDF